MSDSTRAPADGVPPCLSQTRRIDSTDVPRVSYALGGLWITARMVPCLSRKPRKFTPDAPSIVVGMTATSRPPGRSSLTIFATNRSPTSPGLNSPAMGWPYFPVEYLPHGGLLMMTS